MEDLISNYGHSQTCLKKIPFQLKRGSHYNW